MDKSTSPDLQQLRLLGEAPDLRKNAEQSVFKDAVIRWLAANSPPTLGQLFLAEDVQPGRLFALFTNFYCLGLVEVRKAIERKNKPVPPALAYAKLDDLAPGWKVECKHRVALRTDEKFPFANRMNNIPSFALGSVSHHRIGAAFDVNGAHFSEFEVPARRHICVLTDKNADAQIFGSRFQARCEIDRISDCRVIHTLGGTDVADDRRAGIDSDSTAY